MTQQQRILDYLKTFGDITPLEAIRDLGVLALSQRIGELKRSGVAIVTETAVVVNRWGQECRVARYRLGANTPAQAGQDSIQTPV